MKSKFFSKIFCILLILPAVIFLSCQKDNSSEAAIVNSKKVALRTTISPTVENGMLRFESKDDGFTYLQAVNEQLEIAEDGNADSLMTESFASQLNSQMQAQYNFKSLYSSEQKDEYGDLKDPIFGDAAFNLLMNEHGEIMLGDFVYVHKTASEYYKIPKGRTDLINAVREVSMNTLLPVDKMYPDIEIFNMDNTVFLRLGGDCKCNIRIEVITFGVVTPGMTKYRLTYSCEGVIPNSKYYLKASDNPTGSGHYQLFWQTSGNISSTGTGTIDFMLPEDKKDLKFELCLTLNCGEGVKQICYDMAIKTSDQCCKKISTWCKESISSTPDVKMVMKVQNGTSVWGYWHWSQVICKSHPLGSKLKASKLENWLHVAARNSPSSNTPCLVAETDDDYDSCINCKENSENIFLSSHNLHHKAGDCVFEFKMKRHNNSHFDSIVPDYCLTNDPSTCK